MSWRELTAHHDPFETSSYGDRREAIAFGKALIDHSVFRRRRLGFGNLGSKADSPDALILIDLHDHEPNHSAVRKRVRRMLRCLLGQRHSRRSVLRRVFPGVPTRKSICLSIGTSRAAI